MSSQLYFLLWDEQNKQNCTALSIWELWFIEYLSYAMHYSALKLLTICCRETGKKVHSNVTVSVIKNIYGIPRGSKEKWSFQSGQSSLSFLNLWVCNFHQILKTFQTKFLQVFLVSSIPSVTLVTCMLEIVP